MVIGSPVTVFGDLGIIVEVEASNPRKKAKYLVKYTLNNPLYCWEGPYWWEGHLKHH